MLKALARRLVLSLVVIWLVTVLVFVSTEVLPGDALQVSLTADEAAQMSEADFAKRRAELGLDRPAAVRYFSWLAGAARGDFGKTIIGREDVATVIGYPLRNSILLGLVTALVAIPAALAIGIAAAYWRGRWPDLLASSGAIVGYSIPAFASGNFLVLCFAIWLPVFPAMITAFTRDAPSTLIAAAFLPVATVVIGSIAHLVRLVRAGFIEALNSDYVERARLAGASELSLVLRHALPASVIPALNSAALYVAGLLSGIIVVEKVFAYPGLGLVLIQAVEKREVAVVQAISLVAAVIVVSMNLLADAAVMALDPRAAELTVALRIDKFALRKPAAILGLTLVAIHLFLAFFSPWIAPYDPLALVGGRAEAPGGEFLLGTDVLGRDYLSRLLYGGRMALLVTFTGVVAAVGIGSLLGVAAAYFGGLLDDVLMRICDIKLALPGILFVSLFITGFGESLPVLISLIGLVYFPGVIRIVRAQAMTQVNLGYVKAAQLRGESPPSVIAREILPNTLDVVYVEFAIRMSHAVLLLSTMSYLGLGLSPPTPDWGLMVAEGVGQLSFAPWLVLFPAVFISTLVVGLNFGAEALANAFGMDAARGHVGGA